MNGADRLQSLPAGLRRGVPRPVRLTGAGKVVLAGVLLSVVEASLLGAWLYRAAERSRAEAEELRRATAVTDGVVTAVRKMDKQPSLIEYEFTVDGVKHRGRFRGRQSGGTAYRPGLPLRVAYLPANPRVNWPAGREQGGLPLWLSPLVTASSLLVAAALGLWLHGQRRLLEDGRAAVGAVTRVETIRGESTHYRVHYEFRLPSGATRTGRYDTGGRAPAPGDPVVVVYDPENPRRQHRYPLPLVCVATD